MWRTTLTTLTARWRRLLLTGTAVLLGITFVTGALVITDTSAKAFDDQFADAAAGVDLVVRGRAAFGAAMGVDVEREPMSDDVLARIRAVPGVEDASGSVAGSALLVVDGDAVIPKGPSMGLSWQPDPFSPFAIEQGRAPTGDGEVAIDLATADAAGVAVGDRVAVQVDRGQEPFTVVGLASFGDSDGIPNATVAIFAPAQAQALLDLDGQLTQVDVVTDRPAEEVLPDLSAILGEDYEITTAQDVAAASAASAKEELGYIKTMLLVLAATALLVGAFLIANTFSIVVTQRTRELAMLRAIGATGRQITASVLLEAAAVGLLASAAGIGTGLGAATLLRRLVAATGLALPPGPLVVSPRTVATGMLVGVVITVASAVPPARRAAKIAPVTALRAAAAPSRPSVARRIAGVAAKVGGAGVLVGGATDGALPLLGVGALLIVTGAVLLAPAAIAPLAGAVGAPLTALGVVGRMARSNAEAAPRRTAATAMALAIGLAVISFMTVVAESVKESMRSEYAEVVTADVIVESARGEMLGGVSPMVHHHLTEMPEVAAASRLRYGHWLDDGVADALTGVDPDTVLNVAALQTVDGDLDGLRTGGIAVAQRNATKHGLHVGDRLTMTLPLTGDQDLEVVAILDDAAASAMATGYLVSLDTYDEHFGEDIDAAVLVQLADGIPADAGLAAIEAKLAEFPTVAVQDQAQARAARTAMIDSILSLVTVLLLLAVGIALLGIANTLGLSIVERTREVGLLRAVGAGRRQVAWMVRLEAVLVAAVGALAGIGLGLTFGWATVTAMGAQADLALVVPTATLAGFLAVAAVGGALAGMLPARRAARMDVLAAINSE